MDSADSNPPDVPTLTQAPEPVATLPAGPSVQAAGDEPPPPTETIILPPFALPAPTPPPAAPAAIFRVDQARLALLQAARRRRIGGLLWLMAVGVALGFLLLIPLVHTVPVRTTQSPLAYATHDLLVAKGPLWAIVLRVIGLVAPALALAIGLLLLVLLWREARLRRQCDLHLAVGRQGILFFLPGQTRCWLLLPWEQISQISAHLLTPGTRTLRLRTILWRRLARLRRLYRHGRQLADGARPRPAVQSPFTVRALAQQPRQMLRITCTGRLPAIGYGWLFRLAVFTRRVSPQTFQLETGWFVSARAQASPASPGTNPLQQLLVRLWSQPAQRAGRAPVPLPRRGGAVLLKTLGATQRPEVRHLVLAGWAALPLIPALSVVGTASALVQGEQVGQAQALNVATLLAVTLGMVLLLVGMQRRERERAFLTGAALLALAGLLNLAFAATALLADWPWKFREAPALPFLFLECLAGVLLVLGALALAVEGRVRTPGVSPGRGAGRTAGLQTGGGGEVALALGLLALGLARVLEDLDLAVLLSANSAATLQLLRDLLAEPLLPLVILGLSYFDASASVGLAQVFRALQVVYGLALAILAPGAFVLVHQALEGPGLPRPWLPLLALLVVCGALIAISAAFRRPLPDP